MPELKKNHLNRNVHALKSVDHKMEHSRKLGQPSVCFIEISPNSCFKISKVTEDLLGGIREIPFPKPSNVDI